MLSTQGQLLLLLQLVYFIVKCNSYRLVQEVSGTVEAGEYKSYKLEPTSTLALVLVSDRGDADLYVSLTSEPPTFEHYDFASQSCGLEVVVLPDTKESAVSSVYGHIRYNTTMYRLFLIECPRDMDMEYYDPLKIANDPALINLIKQLKIGSSPNTENSWHSVGEWLLWFLGKCLELGVEIFL